MSPIRRPTRLIPAGLVLAISVALVQPAAADSSNEAPAPPQVRTERVYFHCPSSSTKLSNTSFLVDGTIPHWNTTAPATSVGDGAGCGTADPNTVTPAEPQENAVDGVWRGTFTGNLDTLTVQVHCLLCVGTSRATDQASVRVRLDIDGTAMTGNGSAIYPLAVVQKNLGLTQLYEFSITKLQLIEPNTDTDGDGIGDNPFGRILHQLTLTLEGGDPATNAFATWAYDSTEVPSGIVFNPSSLAATRIERS